MVTGAPEILWSPYRGSDSMKDSERCRAVSLCDKDRTRLVPFISYRTDLSVSARFTIFLSHSNRQFPRLLSRADVDGVRSIDNQHPIIDDGGQPVGGYILRPDPYPL